MMTKTRTQLEALCLLQDDDLPLDRMALLFAAEHQHDHTFDVSVHLQQLDAFAASFRTQFSKPTSAQLVQYLHQELQFSGNTQHYNRIDNSFFNRVLELRRGIPITLALVHLSVAERVDLSAEGINFPGHFLVRFNGPDELLIDPFTGRRLSRSECEVLLKQNLGQHARLTEAHLAPASRRAFLMRLIENMKQCYWRERAWMSAEHCLNQQRLLEPEQPVLKLQLGNVKELRGDLDAARALYASLIQLAKDSDVGKLAAQRLLAMGGSKHQIH
jgi:regulator of sirC expression with transglutaminase-like and TPR domain